MDARERIISIDIMRGLFLILMLFFIDYQTPGEPSLPVFGLPNPGEMGLTGWIFSGFLFLTGMAIPYSIGNRITPGENTNSITRHIVIRSISLIIIGVLMLNSDRVNPEFTGIDKNLWAIIMYIALFLIWNNYKENDKNFFTITGLKLLGIGLLIILIFKFMSGEFENNGSLITSWWGLLGQLGWGYLAAAFIYLATRESIQGSAGAFLFFLLLSILSNLDLLSFLDIAKPILGVIIEGFVPMIIIAGVITSQILKKHPDNFRKVIVTIVTIGISIIISGVILNSLVNSSGTGFYYCTPLIFCGINMLLFSIIYFITDTWKQVPQFMLLQSIGKNSLTAYLITYLIYNIIWITGIPVLYYKQSLNPLVLISGSAIWTIVIIGITVFLARLDIRIKI